MVFLHFLGYVCTGLVAAVFVVGALMYKFPRLNPFPHSIQMRIAGAAELVAQRCWDSIKEWDPDHPPPPGREETPEEVLAGGLHKNSLAVAHHQPAVHDGFHHVSACYVGCGDPRHQGSGVEVCADPRKNRVVITTLGSALPASVLDMLRVAVLEKKAKVIFYTTHTDCAAEKIARDAKLRAKYPLLANDVDCRFERLQQFVDDPEIAQLIRTEKLIVVHCLVDIHSVEMTVQKRFTPSSGGFARTTSAEAAATVG